MSRSELDEIQKQLKVAIQNHQMLMAQMKNNPQDSTLQRRIHATQREISSLGEKQKGIFQLLRKTTNPPNGTADTTKDKACTNNPVPAHRPLLPAHMPVNTVLSTVNAHGTPATAHTTPAVATHAVTSRPTTAHKPKPAHSPAQQPVQAHTNALQNKSNLVLPANLNSLALALGPNATLTLPMSTGGSLTLPASALPPHLLKPGTRLTLPVAGRNIPLVPVRPKISTTTNSSSVSSTPRPTTSSPAPSSSPSAFQRTTTTTSTSRTSLTNHRTTPMDVDTPVDPMRMKQDFMATLDLVSPERMKELQSKRTERKRRTTANPNFSYGNNYLSERKYGLNNYLSAMQARRHNRHRGESPLPHSLPPSPCSANGVQGHNNLHNGESMDIHDDYCAVCRRSGQLLMCDTCSLVYHLHCLTPPLTQIPTGTWRCPKCEIEHQKRLTSSPALAIADNNNTPPKQPPPAPTDAHFVSILRQSLTPPFAGHPPAPSVAPVTATPAVPALIVPKPQLTVPRIAQSPARATSPRVSPQTSPSKQGENISTKIIPETANGTTDPAGKTASIGAEKKSDELTTKASTETEKTSNSDTEKSPLKDSVAILRAAKEEERRKLLTEQQKLQTENIQLQQRAQQLSQSINAQMQSKADLVQTVESTQQSIDAIHQFIEVFKT